MRVGQSAAAEQRAAEQARARLGVGRLAPEIRERALLEREEARERRVEGAHRGGEPARSHGERRALAAGAQALAAHQVRAEDRLALGARRRSEVARQPLGELGLGQRPGDELLGRGRRRADVDARVRHQHLISELAGHELAPVHERSAERAQAGVDHALREAPGQVEGLAQQIRRARRRLLLDHEHAQPAHAEPHAGGEAGQGAAQHHRVPAPGAQTRGLREPARH